jgi:hypothetical protein
LWGFGLRWSERSSGWPKIKLALFGFRMSRLWVVGMLASRHECAVGGPSMPLDAVAYRVAVRVITAAAAGTMFATAFALEGDTAHAPQPRRQDRRGVGRVAGGLLMVAAGLDA